MQTIKNRSIAALGAIVATTMSVVAASPARAESIEVRYHDLDLRSPAGKLALHRRIRAAATQVCGPQETLFRMQAQDCRRNAIAQAEAAIPAIRTASQVAAR